MFSEERIKDEVLIMLRANNKQSCSTFSCNVLHLQNSWTKGLLMNLYSMRIREVILFVSGSIFNI